MISVAEEKFQKAGKPEQSTTQMGLQLDATFTIMAEKRFLSAKPDSLEALRTKYKVMGNQWLLAQMRQPNRKTYQDLTPATFDKHLEVLLKRQLLLQERN